MPGGRRAANGTGSVFRRADGKWVAKVTVDGKVKRLYASTRKEAEDKRLNMLEEKRKGTLVAGSMPTVREWLDYWLENVVKPERSAWTYTSYESAIRTHIVPELGAVKLDRLQPADIRTWLRKERQRDSKRGGKTAPGSLRRYRAILHAALKQAVDDQRISRNVVDAVGVGKVREDIPEPFEPEQINTLRAAVKGDPLEHLYTLSLLGLRQGELLGLRWGDVDLQGRVLHIRYQLQRGQLTDLKTESSRRDIPLPSFALAALTAQRGDVVPLPTAPVFTGPAGAPLYAHGVLDHYKGVLRRAGLPDRTFHALRHSAATFLLLQGVDVKTVGRILGHANIRTTQRYVHVLDRMAVDAMDRLDALFGGS